MECRCDYCGGKVDFRMENAGTTQDSYTFNRCLECKCISNMQRIKYHEKPKLTLIKGGKE